MLSVVLLTASVELHPNSVSGQRRVLRARRRRSGPDQALASAGSCGSRCANTSIESTGICSRVLPPGMHFGYHPPVGHGKVIVYNKLALCSPVSAFFRRPLTLL